MSEYTNEQLIAYTQDELKLLRDVSAKLPRITALKMDIVIHEAALAALTSAPVVPEEMPHGLAGQIVSLLTHNIGDKFLGQKIWNACRSAMIATAPGKEG